MFCQFHCLNLLLQNDRDNWVTKIYVQSGGPWHPSDCQRVATSIVIPSATNQMEKNENHVWKNGPVFQGSMARDGIECSWNLWNMFGAIFFVHEISAQKGVFHFGGGRKTSPWGNSRIWRLGRGTTHHFKYPALLWHNLAHFPWFLKNYLLIYSSNVSLLAWI